MLVEIISTTHDIINQKASAEYIINDIKKSVDFNYVNGDIYKIASEAIKKIEQNAEFPNLPSIDVVKIEKVGKLANLEAEYEANKNELKDYLMDAILSDDNDTVAELKEEMAEIEAQYQIDRKELEG